MKTKKLGLLFTAVSMLLTSCSDDKIDNIGKNKITFASGINEYTTRVNDDGNGWLEGDSVGIYMVENGLSTILSTCKNVKHFSTESGEFTSFSTEFPIYYPKDGSAVDFIAYHPHSSRATNGIYPIDLLDQSKQSVLDLMYAESYSSRNQGYNQTHESAVELTFSHMLTKIVMNVTAEEEISNMVVTMKNMDRAAEFDLMRGEISSRSSNGEITAVKTTNGTYEGILLPVESLTDSHIVEFAVGDKTYKWTMSKNSNVNGGTINKLEQGYKYTFNIILSKTGMQVEVVSSSGSVSPWENGGGGNGSASKEDEDDIDKPVVGNVDPTKLYGYAENATGGEGATSDNIFHFNDGNCFAEWLKLREKNKSAVPAIVWLSGEFTASQGRNDMFDIKRTSNITFIGTDNFVMNKVGFFVNYGENIIFKNIYIKLPAYSADGLSMQNSNTIWIDHCTFESLNQTKDAEDGSCDVTHGSYNVTISWCHFITTQKSCLVGHSDSNGSEDQNITVTFHHNYFDKSGSRHPRLRFGAAHVYNNFYNQVTTYGAGSAYGAKLLLEDNYFEAVRLPTDICTYPAKPSGSSWVSNLTGKVAGYLYERNNIFNNKPSNANEVYPLTNVEYTAYGNESTKLSTPLKYDDFKPAYNYVVDDVEEIPVIVPANAGVGKLTGLTTAPIEVNNGGFTPGESGGDGEDDGGDIGTPVTLENDWYALGYNSSLISTSLTNEGKLILTGTGKFESAKQTFSYVYRAVEGNFVITTKLENPTFEREGSAQAQTGLMVTSDITQSDNNLLFCTSSYSGDSNYYNLYRVAVGNRSNPKMSGASGEGNIYLKLERNGSEMKASYSLDGGNSYCSDYSRTFTTDLPNTVYVGLIVSSGDSSLTASATFSDIQINGSPAPSFTE